MNVVPDPEEDPRCACGALLTAPERLGRRNAGLCRKCRARAHWQRREQARCRRAAGRASSTAAARGKRRA